MTKMEQQPLVSVAVVTYNSSGTIIETLDSIAAQTYQNIELIVSDDCSTDNTLEIVCAWIDEHKDRFVRCELITTNKNTGPSGNYNRAVAACHGTWIKEVDGDDMLLPHCVQRYVEYVVQHPQTIYLFGKVEVFGYDADKVHDFVHKIFDYSFFQLPISKQYEWLIARGTQPIPSVTSFYHKEAVDRLGIIYDERIPMLEDWPRWIQCVEKGIRFEFIDEVIARYRVCPNSICSGDMHHARFTQSGAMMYLLYKYPHNIKYIGRRKAIQTYITCKALVSSNPLWKIIKGVMTLAYIPYEWYKNRNHKH